MNTAREFKFGVNFIVVLERTQKSPPPREILETMPEISEA